MKDLLGYGVVGVALYLVYMAFVKGKGEAAANPKTTTNSDTGMGGKQSMQADPNVEVAKQKLATEVASGKPAAPKKTATTFANTTSAAALNVDKNADKKAMNAAVAKAASKPHVATFEKVPYEKGVPGKPPGNCSNGKAPILRTFTIGRNTSTYPSGRYRQWVCQG